MTALSVANVPYLIARNIEQAPSIMMVRELITNAIEASVNAKNPEIQVLETDPAWFGFGKDFGFNSKKLTFWNNGAGMSPKELRKAVDLSSSLNKTQRLDQNFGIGAKVTTMAVNKEGMIWVSCKNKKVSVALLKRETTDHGPEYVRFDFVESDGESPTNFKDIWDITNEKLIPWSLEEDWTAVILCGNNLLQNTAERPYAPDHQPTSAWLINEMYRRFFRIPSNLNIQLFTGHSKGGKVSFRTVSEYIKDIATKKPDDVMEECVEDINGTGLKIWYVYDGEYSGVSRDANKGKPTTTVSNPATTPSFSGLVYKNEIYDVCSEMTWKGVAARLGVLYGAKYFRIFVELPDLAKVMPDQYRQKITLDDVEKQTIGILDYAKSIRNNMPEWFKEKQRKYAPGDITSNDIQQKLQDLLNKLLVTQKSDLDTSSNNGLPSKQKYKSLGNGVPHIPQKKTPKMSGSGKMYEIPMQVPPFQHLWTADQVEGASATGIKHRAAEYIEDQAIFINCTYDPIVETINNLMLDYQNNDDETKEKIANEAKNIAVNQMSFLVGKAVVYSLAKKSKAGYDQEEIEKALHPVSLTTHADGLIDTLAVCRQELAEKVKQINAELI